MKEEEVKKKPTAKAEKKTTTEAKKKTETKNQKKAEEKKDNKFVKIIILIIIVIASMFLGWLFTTLMDNTCDVTFSVGNGKNIVVKVEKDNGVVRPADPEKEGYTFEGWYYDGVKFDFSTPVTKDMTITAIWSENGASVLPTPSDRPTAMTYAVIFDSKDGSEVATQTVEENATLTEPTNPTRSGYTFDGWYLGETKFDFTTKITANITLVAKWTKVEEKENTSSSTTNKETVTKYTVKFNYGYSNKVTSKSVEKGKTVSKPSNPTRSGYTFLGWYYNGEKFDFSTKITKSITLTAKWEKKDVITYKIEDIPNSVANQQMLYVLKNGKKVAGTVSITNTAGKTVTRSVPATGITIVKGTYTKISNVKAN